MPKVSRWKLDEGTEKDLIRQLWNAFSLLKNKKEVIDFIKALLTPTETLMLAKRIEMAKLHQDEVEINKMMKLLHITKTTAYRWKDRYILRKKEFDLIVDKLKKLDAEKYAKKFEAERDRARNEGLPRIRKLS